MKNARIVPAFVAVLFTGISILGCGSNDFKVAGAPDINELSGPEIDLPTPGMKPVPPTSDATSASPTPAANEEAAVKTVAIKVNTMSCVEGCFNGIQSVLKKRDGITEVALAPQENKEGLIDNSVIYVSYRGDLHQEELQRTILGAGFDSIEFLDAK